jgi:hypothetical protein
MFGYRATWYRQTTHPSGTALADDDFPPEVGHLLSQILGPGVELARLVEGSMW